MSLRANGIDVVETLTEMFDQGFEVSLGPHNAGVRGYFASFFKDETGIGEVPIWNWEEIGHGNTILEALKQARAIALGEPFTVRPFESFAEAAWCNLR